MRNRDKAMRLLCATDLLPKSEIAIERAGLMAQDLDAELSLLHVVVPSQSDRALEQHLQQAIAQARARARPPLWKYATTPEVIVKTGSPANRIIETMDEVGARLAVLGPHRRRAARDALSGTIAGKVLSARTAPVLIVKQEPRGSYRNVLLALDLSEVSSLALRAAESFVMTPETRAMIVHAYEPPSDGMLAYAGVREEIMGSYRMRWARNTEIAVRDLIKRNTRDFTRYSIVLKETHPTPAILEAADRVHPDLLILGTRGHGRLRRALLGSVANRVLHNARCDVLIVPEGSMQLAEESTAPMRKRRRAPMNQVVSGA